MREPVADPCTPKACQNHRGEDGSRRRAERSRRQRSCNGCRESAASGGGSAVRARHPSPRLSKTESVCIGGGAGPPGSRSFRQDQQWRCLGQLCVVDGITQPELLIEGCWLICILLGGATLVRGSSNAAAKCPITGCRAGAPFCSELLDGRMSQTDRLNQRHGSTFLFFSIPDLPTFMKGSPQN